MTDNDVKYYDKAKYEEKVLVWLAISHAGLSEYYIVSSKMAVNQTVYLGDKKSVNFSRVTADDVPSSEE